MLLLLKPENLSGLTFIVKRLLIVLNRSFFPILIVLFRKSSPDEILTTLVETIECFFKSGVINIIVPDKFYIRKSCLFSIHNDIPKGINVYPDTSRIRYFFGPHYFSRLPIILCHESMGILTRKRSGIESDLILETTCNCETAV